MGAISRWFADGPKKSKKSEPKGTTGWIKVDPDAGRSPFWYKITEERGIVNAEVKVFKDAGSDKTVDIATGVVSVRKYENFTHYTYRFNSLEEAGEELISNVRNSMNYYGRGTVKKVYLD